ncbi:MAG: hypothetical protein AAF702_21460 [Chloroflexota bacterium]
MSILTNIFGIKNKIKCPKCQQISRVDTDTATCSQTLADGTTCNYVFPLQYIKNYNDATPLFVQVFGWTGHGKTVFLDALRLHLLDMRKLWPDYTHQSVTQLDIEHERQLRSTLRGGGMPPPTQRRDRQQNEVYIMKLENMLRWGSKWLVIMDHAGEKFEDFNNVPVEELPFLLNTATTFMLISIPKMESGESMDQLLNIYIETMVQNKINFNTKRRELIIILTMADMLPQLPPVLKNYLRQDNIWNSLRSPHTMPVTEDDMESYIAQMKQVSDVIRRWLLTDSDGAPGGANLVGLIERNNIQAHYTLISATGHDVTELDTDDGMQIMPKRVLDPFFWALEYEAI